MAVGASGARNEFNKSENGQGAGTSKPALVSASASGRSDSELFQRVRARLRAAVGEDVFNSWFARLELEEVIDDKAHLSVPTRFLCSWIQSNYAEKILDTFKTEMPNIERLHFTVRVNGQARPRLNPPPEVHAEAAEAEPLPLMKPHRESMQPRGDALSGSARSIRR